MGLFLLVVFLATTVADSAEVLSGPDMASRLEVGSRVVRGQDWSWGNQDGDPPGKGTVLKLSAMGLNGVVEVLWDAGRRDLYQMGSADKYDLRLLDEEPVTVNISKEGSSETMNGAEMAAKIKVGSRVAPGADWSPSDTRRHGGLPKSGTVIELEPMGLTGWVNVLWDDGTTGGHLMGADDTYELRLIEDTPSPTTRVSSQAMSGAEIAAKIKVGSRVAPGADWSPSDTLRYGELPKSGTVIELKPFGLTGWVRVLWDGGSNGAHLMGADGKYELRLLDDQPSGTPIEKNIRGPSEATTVPATSSQFEVGSRVVRGKHWMWGSQDGVPPGKGTVVELDPDNESGWVSVKWDTGYENNYRVGSDGKYDLRLVDEQTFHASTEATTRGPSEATTVPTTSSQFKVGSRVVRGKDWIYDSQDGDPPGKGTVIELDPNGHSGWVSVKWDSGDENNYRVGSGGKVDLRLVDEQTLDATTEATTRGPSEATTVPTTSSQFKVGSRVVRGKDWIYDSQDGDPPGKGTVIELDPDNESGWVSVKWDSGDENNYRVGSGGKVDLRLVDEQTLDAATEATTRMCGRNRFGAACRQTCGHCRHEGECDPYNGHCLGGCSLGYHGDSCHEAMTHLIVKPNVTVTNTNVHGYVLLAPENIDGSGEINVFEVQIKMAGGDWTTRTMGKPSRVASLDVNGFNFTVDGLRPDSDVDLRVLLLDKDLNAFHRVPQERVHTAGHRRVVGLSVSNVTSRSVQVSWTTSAENEVVSLQYECKSLASCAGVDEGACLQNAGRVQVSGGSALLENLLPDAKYRITVTIDDDWETVTAYTDAEVPEAIVSTLEFRQTAVGSGLAEWGAPEPCEDMHGHLRGFHWQLTPMDPDAAIRRGNTTASFLALRHLVPGKSYELRVHTVNTEGRNPLRFAAINITMQHAAPSAPLELTAYRWNRTSLWLRWRPPALPGGELRSYTVQVGRRRETVAPGTGCKAWPDRDVVCVGVHGLRPSQRHSVVVSASNLVSDQQGEQARVTVTTNNTVSSPPQELKVLSVTSSSAALQWQLPWMLHGAPGYFEVAAVRHFGPEATSAELVVPDPQTPPLVFTEELPLYEYVVEGLEPGSTYSITVRSGGTGEPATTTITTLNTDEGGNDKENN